MLSLALSLCVGWLESVGSVYFSFPPLLSRCFVLLRLIAYFAVIAVGFPPSHGFYPELRVA